MISDRAIAEVAALQESRRREYQEERKRAEVHDRFAAVVRGAIDGSPNAAWLVLPGTLSLAPELAKLITDDALAAGYRPPARVIETQEDLDALTFPCLIREEPTDSTDFYPQIWEMGFQTDWCRAGSMYDPDDCTPRLPVTVLVETEEWNR